MKTYDENINGSDKGQLIVYVDSYNDDVVGLVNKECNVNIELLLEERGN